MPRAGFEPKTPVTKQKAYALDGAATGTGLYWVRFCTYNEMQKCKEVTVDLFGV
jgi:hypothetical protein